MHSPLRRRRFATIWLGVCASALTGVAAADPAPSYSELLRRAQSNAPRLAEARSEVARAKGLARQAAARPNPTVGIEVENFSGSGPYSGSGLAETTASISQALELGGKRTARFAVGRAEVEAARLANQQAEASFAYDLAIAYAQAEASDRRIGLAEEALSLAMDDARVAGALVEAGREADLRRVQAQAAMQSSRASLEEARAARATAFGTLTSLAGEPIPLTSTPVSLLAQSQATQVHGPPDPLLSPGYLAAEAAREAAARRIRVEQTRVTPDVSVSAGVRRFQADGSTAVVAGLSAPFPLFDRNRGNISAAQAELAAAEARLNAARLDAQAEAISATARLSSSGSRLRAAREGEAAAEEAYRLTRLGYEGGKLALIELLGARRALTDAHSQALDAALEQLSAQAALARLQGRAPFGDQQ